MHVTCQANFKRADYRTGAFGKQVADNILFGGRESSSRLTADSSVK